MVHKIYTRASHDKRKCLQQVDTVTTNLIKY